MAAPGVICDVATAWFASRNSQVLELKLIHMGDVYLANPLIKTHSSLVCAPLGRCDSGAWECSMPQVRQPSLNLH